MATKKLNKVTEQNKKKDKISYLLLLSTLFYFKPRNGSCVEEKIQNANQCDIRCNRKTGVCINKRCRCTRGWIGPNAVYNRSLDTYVADYCDQECPYIGFGRE